MAYTDVKQQEFHTPTRLIAQALNSAIIADITS